MGGGLIPMPRDVLKMLQVELRLARSGEFRLHLNADGVDMDLVEMLEETITEIKRLRALASDQRRP